MTKQFEQMDLEGLHEEGSDKEKQPTYDVKIHCQFCQDVGVCTFCERGLAELSKQKKI